MDASEHVDPSPPYSQRPEETFSSHQRSRVQRALVGFNFPKLTQVSIANGNQIYLVAAADQQRVHVRFEVPGVSTTVYFSPRPQGLEKATPLAWGSIASGGIQALEIFFALHGALACSAWYAVTALGGQLVNVTELEYWD